MRFYDLSSTEAAELPHVCWWRADAGVWQMWQAVWYKAERILLNEPAKIAVLSWSFGGYFDSREILF